MCAPEIGKNISVGAAANESQQVSGHVLEQHRLADHEQNGDGGVSVTVASFELVQSFSQKVENEKEVSDYEHGINDQLNQKRADGECRFLFHFTSSPSH